MSTPTRTVSENGETIRITSHGFVADIDLCSPFEPAAIVREPMPEGFHVVPSLHAPTSVERTMEVNALEDLWSVLTMALAELAPGYCAPRLREIEGEELRRQEA